MSWEVRTEMSERTTFCALATQEGANISALCREYGISRKTAYKWLGRYSAEGKAGLSEQSRRPKTMPAQTNGAMEAKVVAVRKQHPRWGGRKIHHLLLQRGEEGVPSPSTITAILHRHHLIDAEESQKHHAFVRFVRALPNQLWQMDFKGHFALTASGRCHPLTILDDHSRFLLALRACGNERYTTVQAELTTLLRTYGMPERILADNGSPWGVGPSLLRNDKSRNDKSRNDKSRSTFDAYVELSDDDTPRSTHDDDLQEILPSRILHTPLTVWLLRHDIPVSHGRPRHPQTQGKCERINRTLKEELLDSNSFATLPTAQAAFDAWRALYNNERPHEALQMQVPASRYTPSSLAFPDQPPKIEYDDKVTVRKVDELGRITLQGSRWRVGRAFQGERIALHPTETDGILHAHFGRHYIATINLKA